MRDVNKVILIGRLGADPVLKTLPSGMVVVNFPLATSRRVKSVNAEHLSGGTGEMESETKGESQSEHQSETQWHRITVWGRLAEACAQYLKKGDPAYLEGGIRSRSYDGADGSTRFSFEIHADTVNFLSPSTQRLREQSVEDVA